MIFSIPYGREKLYADFDFPTCEILTPKTPEMPEAGAEELIAQAMDNPIGSSCLRELARGKENAVIIISDHTRPVPSKQILPPMLRQLREGSLDIQITLLVATGCHRETSAAELTAKLGEEIFRREQIVVHNCDDTENMVCLNRIAAETQLLISEGFIEPHFFAGFSGGRKSVLPGICSRETVMSNHCADLIDHPCSCAGILEQNPIHGDMEAAAQMANLKFIVNVLLGENKQVFHAVAGDPIAAMRVAGLWEVWPMFTRNDLGMWSLFPMAVRLWIRISIRWSSPWPQLMRLQRKGQILLSVRPAATESAASSSTER